MDTVNLWANWRNYKWKEGTGDWWKKSPQNLKKYKAFYNDKKTGWTIIIDEHNSLRITGSIPRAVKGNNFESITEKEFPLLENYILSLCKGRCVNINLDKLTISRIDLARNKALDFHVAGFIMEARKVKGYGTLKQSESQEFDGRTYVRWENKQRQIVLYDKIERIIDQQKKHKIKSNTLPDINLEYEWLRSEVRLMQSSSCRIEGVQKFEDLKNNEKQWAVWQKENRRLIGRASELGYCLLFFIQ